MNLIGEHTDYNNGLALPFAIDRGVTVTAEPLAGDRIEARALGEHDSFPLAAGGWGPIPDGWRAFVRGTVAELSAAGYELRPCRLTIESDLEQGAGLSSSAALETALCLALLGEEPDDRVELAKLCSRVENDWVGARTGLLDQLAALCSEPGHAVRIDFATLALEPIPLDLHGWTLVTLDSGATHAIAESGYNERRRECRARVRAAGHRLAARGDRRSTACPSRCAPAPATSSPRTTASTRPSTPCAPATSSASRSLLDAGHASLRDDYDASVPEVERTVERLKQAGAAGARMVGGGFGGAVLGVLRPGVGVPAGALRVAPGLPAGLL